MRRAYKSGAAAAAPSASEATSEGYPTEGNVARGVPATIPGPFNYYMLVEAVVTVIELAGLVPDDDPNQFRKALLAHFATKTALTAAIAAIPEAVVLASNAEHTQANPPADKAATPAGVRAVRDALLDTPPGALDTLNELAAALGDDPHFSATIMGLINARLTQDQVDTRIAALVNGVAGAADSNAANYAVVAGDRGKVLEMDASGGARTVTLPHLDGDGDGFTVTVLKGDNSANDVTVDGYGADTINGAATYALKEQYEAVILKWTGAAWLAIGGATGALLRDFFGAAPYREWTATGRHNFSWEWGTDRGLAILQAGGGGGSGARGQSVANDAAGDSGGDTSLSVNGMTYRARGGEGGPRVSARQIAPVRPNYAPLGSGGDRGRSAISTSSQPTDGVPGGNGELLTQLLTNLSKDDAISVTVGAGGPGGRGGAGTGAASTGADGLPGYVRITPLY